MKGVVILLAFVSACLAVTPFGSPIARPLDYPPNLYNRHFRLWLKERSANLDTDIVPLSVALYQQNLDKFNEMFEQISDPTSSEYANYKTIDEVMDIVAPPKEVEEEVIAWLRSEGGVVSLKSHRDVIEVVLTASAVERLLDTELFVFRHRNLGIYAIRPDVEGYTLPKHMADKVQFITGLSDFPYTKKQKNNWELATLLDERQGGSYYYVIPQTLRALYNIPAGQACTNSKTSQCPMEFYPEVGAPYISDLETFCQNAGETFTNITTIVGPFVQEGSLESELDCQLLYNMGSKAQNWYWSIQNGWAYEMAYQVFHSKNVPMVISMSYGWPEYYTCQSSITYAQCNSTTQDYVTRSNTELQKLGVRGISVLIATQDEGAPSEANEDCSLDNTDMPVYAIYPSSSPFVTAVSATTVMPISGTPLYTPEICADYGCATGEMYENPCETNNTEYQWTTGGGFSVWGAQPSYQTAAVSAYLSSKAFMPPTNLFPSTMRGYADVSACGDRILIYDDGGIDIGAGTSASTPVFSGVVSLLNDRRLNQGKKQLGFLNPLLYQMAAKQPSAFNDITVGSNQCTIGTCCTYGYGATKGWDPVSGLGTPNFGEMIKYIDTIP